MSPAEHTISVQTQDGCTVKPLSIVPDGTAKKSPTQCITKLVHGSSVTSQLQMFGNSAATTNRSTEVLSKLINK